MSFLKYEQYKESGADWLGPVPVEWRVTPLKAIARIINGYPFDAGLFDSSDGIPLVRIRDLNQSVPDARYKGEFVDTASIGNDDVLIGMDGDFNVGRWLGEVPALLNQRMCCVRADLPMVTRYLQYVLPTPLKAINDITYSTTVKHLSSFDVLKIRVAIPASDKHVVAIVRFLDRETAKIDALVEEQKRLIELLKEKRQAVISQAVTKGLDPNVPMKDSGVEWLGEVPAHWEVKSIRHILNAIGDVDHFMPASVESGVPYLMTGDLTDFVSDVRLEDCKQVSRNDYLQLSKRIRTSKGDVVMARYATIGTLMYVDADVEILVSYSCVTLKTNPSKMSGMYLFQYMKSDPFRRGIEHETNTNTQGNVGIKDLQGLKVVAPPADEQAAIVTFLHHESVKIDRLTAEANSAIDLLQERRSALISAAVTGKIDVRSQVAQSEALAA